MSFVRREPGRQDDQRAVPGYEHEHRAARSGWLCEATLACARCDAPISVGERPLGLAETLRCPYCALEGPARDFLTLGEPTRPARVALRLRLP